MATETMAAAAPFATSQAARGANFWDALTSEWVKLTSLRFTYITLGLGLTLSLATTALASLAMASTQNQWSAGFDPFTFSMVGNVFALIIYSVFGVMCMSGEYTSGMIRLTFTATPRRGRVFLAKLVLVSLIVLVFGLLTTIGMFLVWQAILGAYGLEIATFGDADARRLVIGLGAAMPFFPLIGVALGVLLRSTAGAITTVLGLLWLPLIFGEVLPMWWRENVISLLPGTALDSLTIAHVVDSPTYTDPAVAAVIAAAWLTGFIGAAYVVLIRRDA
jgi:ABC-2 type transport system permease protein